MKFLLQIEKCPSKKCGPNLIAPSDSINGYKQLGVDFLTLANNHIMDQSEHGLTSTESILDKAGIAHAGSGENLHEASKPYVAEISGIRIGIYCCAEHEFSIAGELKPGANPFDPLESLDHISELKKNCDFAICLYHGGKEHYRFPSPCLQKTCRKIAEKGADLVVCQHSHCIGCEEKWHESTIVYGQGNFLFDHSDSEFWKTSLLICIDINSTGMCIEYKPIIKNGGGVKSPDPFEAERILNEFHRRSEEIIENGFIEKEYKKIADEIIGSYLISVDSFGSSFYFRVFNKIFGHRLGPILVSKKLQKSRERLINQFACEAHRELILKGLEDREYEP